MRGLHALINSRPAFKPLFNERALVLGYLRRVIHGHGAQHDGLLINRLGVLGQQGGRVQADIFHLHGLAVAAVAALGDNRLDLRVADGDARLGTDAST